MKPYLTKKSKQFLNELMKSNIDNQIQISEALKLLNYTRILNIILELKMIGAKCMPLRQIDLIENDINRINLENHIKYLYCIGAEANHQFKSYHYHKRIYNLLIKFSKWKG